MIMRETYDDKKGLIEARMKQEKSLGIWYLQNRTTSTQRRSDPFIVCFLFSLFCWLEVSQPFVSIEMKCMAR